MLRSSTRLSRYVLRGQLNNRRSRVPVAAALKKGGAGVRPLRRRTTKDLKNTAINRSNIQDDKSDGMFDVDKLIKTLPTLPPHQQEVVRSLLSDQGRDKVDAMLKEEPIQGEIQEKEVAVTLKSGRKDRRRQLTKNLNYDSSLSNLQGYFPIIADKPYHFDKLFWKCVQEFAKLDKLQRSTTPSTEELPPPPYEFLGQLFEVAKLQKHERTRYACIKLVGDLLYSYNTVRMDPFNEVEYLDSLCYFGNSYKAIQIWKSRRNKADVQGSIYWLEVGIQYYQHAKLMANAEQLAEEMKTEFNYIQPRVILGFIESYGPTVSQSELVEKWVNEFINIINENDMKLSSGEGESAGGANDINQEEANDIFNIKKCPTEQDLERAISILLKNNWWTQAAQLIEYMEKCGMKNSAKKMLIVLNATTRKLINDANFKYSDKSKSFIPRLKRNKKAVIPEHRKQLMVVISKIISVYPEVLEDPKFYESWLRGLTGLELYENAIRVVEAMVDRGIKPTAAHVHTLIKSLLAKGQLSTAYDLLDRLEKPPPSSNGLYPAPNPSIYGLFMSYAARRSDHELVKTIVNRMYENGYKHSEATLNTLIFYYYRHKDFNSLFKLLDRVIENNFVFSHINYRTIWLSLRDYYYLCEITPPKTITAASTIDLEPGVRPPDLRQFFGQMVNNPKFKLSLNVFEHSLQAMLLSRDYVGASAILCYMETVNNIKIPGVLAASVLQLADKIRRKTTYSFPKPSRQELIVEPGYVSEASVPWDSVARKLSDIFDLVGTTEQAGRLSESTFRSSNILPGQAETIHD